MPTDKALGNCALLLLIISSYAPIVYRLVHKTFNLEDGVQLSVGVRARDRDKSAGMSLSIQ